MPITSDGKEPDFTYLQHPFVCGIKKIANKINRQAPKKTVEKISQKDLVRHDLDEAIAKVSGNGKYRYGERQLFYHKRGYINDVLGKELLIGNFKGIITDIENERGEDLPGIYRDNRGIIFHPHLREEIPLGTLTVERYQRPEYYFNKILYIEKEGFFQILEDDRWGEKHDCAIITSKGYTSRACRDLIDLLGTTEEPIECFCIHDFDAAGTMIYQTFQEKTKARGARNLKIIDLGLKYEDVQALDLEIEKISHNRRQPVADNYKKYEDWLQKNRVELNAMDSPTFIVWITKKIAPYAGKVIPPEDALYNHALKNAEQELREKVREKIEQEMNINELIEREYQEQLPELEREVKNIELMDVVNEDLSYEPEHNWREPVETLTSRLVTEIYDT